MRELIAAFQGLRIVVVGDVMLDEYVTGDCTRLSPEAPIPVLSVRSVRAVPGGAANTAANIAALGGQANLIGAVGDDEAGRTLSRLLDTHSVRHSLVPDARPTTRKVRALGGQQQLLRLDYEEDRPASATTRAAALASMRRHIPGASAVVVSDYAKGLFDRPLLEEVFSTAQDARVPVIVDPRPQHADWYQGCDYVTPNWKEALSLLGMMEARPSDDDAVDAVGWRLVERFGATVLLTLGADGIRCFSKSGGRAIRDRAHAIEVFDVSGAGDTVVAAFALSLAAGADLPSALRVANAAAGVVVGKVGTAVVTPAELLTMAEREGEPR